MIKRTAIGRSYKDFYGDVEDFWGCKGDLKNKDLRCEKIHFRSLKLIRWNPDGDSPHETDEVFQENQSFLKACVRAHRLTWVQLSGRGAELGIFGYSVGHIWSL